MLRSNTSCSFSSSEIRRSLLLNFTNHDHAYQLKYISPKNSVRVQLIMFSRVSTRMAAENGAEVAMEEGNERSSEIQVETLEKKAK